MNNEMDDFSYPDITNSFGVPPSPHNFPIPGKTPLSSMVPNIIVDTEGIVRLVTGASGGTRITSNVGQVILRNLFFDKNVKEAVDAKRLHHQLSPMTAQHEIGFWQVGNCFMLACVFQEFNLISLNQDALDLLESRGHELDINGGAVCQAVERRGGRVLANYDHRKSGGVDGLDEPVAPPSEACNPRQLSASLIILMLLVAMSDYFMPDL